MAGIPIQSYGLDHDNDIVEKEDADAVISKAYFAGLSHLEPLNKLLMVCTHGYDSEPEAEQSISNYREKFDDPEGFRSNLENMNSYKPKFKRLRGS
ncbi:hypothetical protein BaRGS_00005730 [Batillaria attramentaria]|uniref:Uncharacterized protein n=1 Tax=Batillaria attramentaria TaxID=370345 RepID=A0ABD0LU12_9CAEN